MRTLLEELIVAGYNPDQPLPGTFLPLEVLTPSTPSSKSDLNTTIESPNATEAEQGSKDEVKELISQATAQLATTSNITTCSQARAQQVLAATQNAASGSQPTNNSASPHQNVNTQSSVNTSTPTPTTAPTQPINALPAPAQPPVLPPIQPQVPFNPIQPVPVPAPAPAPVQQLPVLAPPTPPQAPINPVQSALECL